MDARKWLCVLGITVVVAAASAEQRWLGANERLPSPDGHPVAFPLPNPGGGPTTLALAKDGTVWFTESGGNRIGRMAPDGSGLKEYPLPAAKSSPRITALRARGNRGFSG